MRSQITLHDRATGVAARHDLEGNVDSVAAHGEGFAFSLGNGIWPTGNRCTCRIVVSEARARRGRGR